MQKLYRYLTGKDDSAFCAKVELALNEGWQLYGDPSMTFNATTGEVVCGQAIVKDADGPYEGFVSRAEMREKENAR